jgi:hypothetical protein
MGLRFCGVDVMVKGSIEEPCDDYWVLEVNAAPGLDHYADVGRRQKRIVDDLYLKVLQAMKDLSQISLVQEVQRDKLSAEQLKQDPLLALTLFSFMARSHSKVTVCVLRRMATWSSALPSKVKLRDSDSF